MNIVIQKLPLPYDIQYEIYNLCYNKYGYTKEQIETIQLLKEKEKGNRLRMLSEVIYWKSTKTAVCWLKGYGGYSSIHSELNILKELLLSNILSKNNYLLILESIKKDLPISLDVGYEEKVKYLYPATSFRVYDIVTFSMDYIIDKIDRHMELA